MKKAIIAFTFALTASMVIAEPIVLTKAGDDIAKGKIEAGIDFTYAYDKYTYAINPGVEYASTEADTALSLKYALDDSIEFTLWTPYVFWNLSATGFADSNANGIGETTLAVKYSGDAGGGTLIGLMLTCDLPTGDSTKQLSVGTNLGSVLLASLPMNPFVVDVNVGYELTLDYYNPLNSKINTGDPITYGAAIELPNGPFTFILEAAGAAFGDYSVDGTGATGTGGVTIDIIPGIRYTADGFKAKLGFAYALGDPTFTKYQWKIISGVGIVL